MPDFCLSNFKKSIFFFHSFNNLLIFCFFWMTPSVLHAEESCLSREFKTFTFYVENDIFAGTDKQYTGGFKLTWSRHGLSTFPEDAWLHSWLYPVVNRLGFENTPETENALTFSIGQSVYTPGDIQETELIRDDRPYAGITYIEIGFHRKLENHMHTLGLCAGIVGPHSYAEAFQTAGHGILNSKEPKGWDHQLEDEPVICLIYDYKQKILTSNINAGVGGDVVFNTGAGIGNVRIYYNIGLMMRYGWNVPNDCGNFPIQPATCINAELKQSVCDSPKKRFGAHLFFSAGSQLVLRDILLDGNTFRDSHSVDKKPVVGVFVGGIGLVYGKIKTVFAYVARTKSFETQQDPEVFGSINFSFQY
jgi:lipid A 3-O-deacylase